MYQIILGHSGRYSKLAFRLRRCTFLSSLMIGKKSVIKDPGNNTSLDCSLEGYPNPNLYWYRQVPGGAIEHLSYSISKGSATDSGLTHIKGTRPSDVRFILEIDNLSTSDTGTYYCAWSHTLNQESAAL
uniref:T cell receptor beta variable 30 n=1 Tax=Anolis carolinensis TaxID=28377 RepID=H9GVD4_ANOCA